MLTAMPRGPGSAFLCAVLAASAATARATADDNLAACSATGSSVACAEREDVQQRGLTVDPDTTSLLQVSRVEQLRSGALVGGQAGHRADPPTGSSPPPRQMLASDLLPTPGRAAAAAAVGLSQSIRATYTPRGSNTMGLWHLAGKWENLMPTSSFCLISRPYERKDQGQLGQGITFVEQMTLEKVRQSVRDRSYDVDGDSLVELWLEGVYYLKIINSSRTDATLGNAIYVREEYLEADPNASRDNPVQEPDPLLHVETGQWLSMLPRENTTAAHAPPLTVTRLASVPHGNSLVASGNFIDVGCKPASEDCMAGEYKRLAQQYSSAPLNYDCGAEALSSYYSAMDQKYGSDYARNPVAFLVNATRGLHIRGFARWEVSTLAQQKGDGLVNVPFLEQQVHPSAFNSTFYLLSVEASDGSTYDLIQYIEGLYLEVDPGCNGMFAKFPHINLNTLKRMSSNV